MRDDMVVGSGYHTYLILSQADSTMVLRTGQEITELDSSGFATETPTIMAGNMASGRYIMQVSCMCAHTHPCYANTTTLTQG